MEIICTQKCFCLGRVWKVGERTSVAAEEDIPGYFEEYSAPGDAVIPDVPVVADIEDLIE